MTLAGFPHSGTPGSRPTCGSPRLFAACRALLRLSMPRHPPCALVRLTGYPHTRLYDAWLHRPTVLLGHFNAGARVFSLDDLHPTSLYPGFQCNQDRRVPAQFVRLVSLLSAGARPEGRTLAYSRLQKGGDPAAGSPTATLLRLRPSHRARLRRLPPLRVGSPTSGAPDSHGVTGGVYKARERIHRGVADPRLLAIPASCSRVTDCNPNLDQVFAIRSASRPRCALSWPL
jgi:hypothetical protein